MGPDVDDEILQDFLIEASEIIEKLGEQLVDLEQRPDDAELLNAIFRGFHTVKGGAGFLSIASLVEVCHRSEDVFNVLRQGQRAVDADLMDAVLQSLDVVNEMMDDVRERRVPPPAGDALLARLTVLTGPVVDLDKSGNRAASAVTQELPAAPQPADAANAVDEMLGATAAELQTKKLAPGGDDVTEAEFESLLDELHGAGQHGGVPQSTEPTAADAKPVGDEITEDEFEALLDELHGPGKFSGAAVKPPQRRGEPVTATASVDDLSEEEFETLLNQMHGRGKHGGVPAAAASPAAASAPSVAAAKPQPKPEKPAAKSCVASSREGVVSPGKTPQSEPTVRVDTKRLDDIMNMVGELVLVRNRLSTLKPTMADEQLVNAVGHLDVVTADLQLAVMKTRMQPVKKIYGRFPRVVRDLARNLRKEVDLVMQGEETDLDKNLVEALADPMVHLVRNAVDHGIEPPDVRTAAGKPSKGRVILSAAQEGDHILLSIEDDGKGLDPDVLRRKVVEKGLMDQQAAARLEPNDCFNLVFHPGFSTKAEISDVSGRGVGMDVVKTKIAQMNGSVEIDSELGKGSKIAIKLPLTLAILPTLMVVLGQQPFALPLASVVEILNLDLSRTNKVDGQPTIRVRERVLPLFYLSRWLINGALIDVDYAAGGGHVVVANVGSMQVGLVVDTLVGQEEVVIKPLGALLQGLEGMAGATITGDGKIALILDVPGLMRKYAYKY